MFWHRNGCCGVSESVTGLSDLKRQYLGGAKIELAPTTGRETVLDLAGNTFMPTTPGCAPTTCRFPAETLFPVLDTSG